MPSSDGDDLAAERATTAKEMRDRRKVVAYILEIMPPALTSKAIRTSPGPDGTTVIRSHRGQLIANCMNSDVAQFLVDAPGLLRAFSTYIEQLEASAFHDRERRRTAEERLELITDELLSASRAGIKTQEGQRLIQAALREARGHDNDTRLATRPPNRQWRP